MLLALLFSSCLWLSVFAAATAPSTDTTTVQPITTPFTTLTRWTSTTAAATTATTQSFTTATSTPGTTVSATTAQVFSATATARDQPTTATTRNCSIHCENGGTCILASEPSNDSCTCLPGFAEFDCILDIDDCADYPCDPFGDCVDLVNGYSCVCLPGFSPTNSSVYCEDINECITTNSVSPCYNNATCFDEINRFRCECPPTGDNDTAFVGLQCENITTSDRFPVIAAIRGQDKGIIAGGARITITGEKFDSYPVLGAYFRPTNYTSNPQRLQNGLLGLKLSNLTSGLPALYGYASANLSTPTTAIITVPRASENYTGLLMEVTVQFSGPVFQKSKLYFRFTENPKIGDINPKTILVTGGIQLTVNGSNMNAIGAPLMVVTVNVYRGRNRTLSSSSIAHSACANDEEAFMKCRLPPLNLSAEFTSSNETKRDGAAVATVRNGSDIANIYIGFELDDLPTYRNISKSNPRINFTMTPLRVSFPPAGDKPVAFNPASDPHLYVKGEQLDEGCSMEDYNITLGAGNCTVDSFTSNQIRCTPPSEQPQSDVTTLSLCGNSAESLALMTRIGAAGPFFIYCVKYPDKPFLTDLIVGLSVGLGGGILLVLILAVIASVVVRNKRRDPTRRRKPKSKNYQESIENNIFFSRRPQLRSADSVETVDSQGNPDYCRDIDGGRQAETSFGASSAGNMFHGDLVADTTAASDASYRKFIMQDVDNDDISYDPLNIRTASSSGSALQLDDLGRSKSRVPPSYLDQQVERTSPSGIEIPRARIRSMYPSDADYDVNVQQRGGELDPRARQSTYPADDVIGVLLGPQQRTPGLLMPRARVQTMSPVAEDGEDEDYINTPSYSPAAGAAADRPAVHQAGSRSLVPTGFSYTAGIPGLPGLPGRPTQLARRQNVVSVFPPEPDDY